MHEALLVNRFAGKCFLCLFVHNDVRLAESSPPEFLPREIIESADVSEVVRHTKFSEFLVHTIDMYVPCSSGRAETHVVVEDGLVFKAVCERSRGVLLKTTEAQKLE